jgi:hypothetical protein
MSRLLPSCDSISSSIFSKMSKVWWKPSNQRMSRQVVSRRLRPWKSLCESLLLSLVGNKSTRRRLGVEDGWEGHTSLPSCFLIATDTQEGRSHKPPLDGTSVRSVDSDRVPHTQTRGRNEGAKGPRLRRVVVFECDIGEYIFST